MLNDVNAGFAGADGAMAFSEPKVHAPRQRTKRGASRVAEAETAPKPIGDTPRQNLNPVSDGSGEASPMSEPSGITPRRKSKRAVHALVVTQTLHDGAQPDQSTVTLLPSPAATDPAILLDAHLSNETPAWFGVQGDDAALRKPETHVDGSPIIAEIIQLWRMRQRWHRAEKSLTLQGKAICRAWTAGDKDAAGALFDEAAAGNVTDPFLAMALAPFLKAIENFEPERKSIEKRLKHLAKSLPVWPWVEEIKGFSHGSLAGIVGEAGDVGSYRNPSCLWKRMGMAVIGDQRQGKRSNADEALAHGYSPQRRAIAYLLGEAMIKTGDKCIYRPVYTARRERTAVTHPDWTKGHSHNDAMRIMTKRAIRDLWIAWRRADARAEPIHLAPVVN